MGLHKRTIKSFELVCKRSKSRAMSRYYVIKEISKVPNPYNLASNNQTRTMEHRKTTPFQSIVTIWGMEDEQLADH